jgi:abortive infection bacteriophage resistance protein
LKVALRAEICNRTAVEWDPHWYTNKLYFNNPDWHGDLIDSIKKSVDRANEQFIRSYKNKYDTPSLPPIWMAMEVISFGELSSMYDNLKDGSVKKLVAAKFGVHDAFLSSWLKSINFVRNCCAHHNRLWNRRIPLKPILPRRSKYRVLNHLDDQTDKQLFGILSCMLYLLKTIGEDDDLRDKIKALFIQYPEINKSYMGLHASWQDEPIWL